MSDLTEKRRVFSTSGDSQRTATVCLEEDYCSYQLVCDSYSNPLACNRLQYSLGVHLKLRALARRAKVEDLDDAIVHKAAARREIAMDEALGMNVLEPARRLITVIRAIQIGLP